MSVAPLLTAIRDALRDAADAERAPGMQAYMKSMMPFRGVPMPSVRAIARSAAREHPLLTVDARQKNDAVEVIIAFKDPAVPVHTYYFEIHPRDLADPQCHVTAPASTWDAAGRRRPA